MPSAMLTATRSVRVTIGRIPSAATASISALFGKQTTCSTPSIFRIFAIAVLPCMGALRVVTITAPRTVIKILHTRTFRRTFMKYEIIDADGHVSETWEGLQKYLDEPYRRRPTNFPYFPQDGW